MNPRDTSRPHVWRPANDAASARTLLLLHGSGANEHDLLPLGKALDPNANLLSPRGLVRMDGADRFFMRYDDGRFDEAGIIKAVSELADFVWAASGEYGFDPDRVWAVGFSNGANASGALLLLHPDTVCGIAAFGTTKSFLKTPFRGARPNLTGKRVWIANGATDDYSPSSRTEAMIEEFTQLGAEVELMVHPGGHLIVKDHIQQIARNLP